MDGYLSFAKKLCLEAGDKALEFFKKENSIEFKSDKDFAITADYEVEKLILDKIKDTYPEHSILSEEAGEKITKSKYRWIIDPIDGTANFKAGLPHFCTTASLQIGTEIALAVIYLPFYEELYYAEKDNGAYMNDKPIKVSKTNDLKQFFVAYGTSNHKNDTAIKLGANSFSKILPSCRAARLSGSSLYDLSHLAKGTYDAMIKVQASFWDYAAGCMIAEEAGATITDFNGNKWGEHTKDIVISNGIKHVEFLEILNK